MSAHIEDVDRTVVSCDQTGIVQTACFAEGIAELRRHINTQKRTGIVFADKYAAGNGVVAFTDNGNVRSINCTVISVGTEKG